MSHLHVNLSFHLKTINKGILYYIYVFLSYAFFLSRVVASVNLASLTLPGLPETPETQVFQRTVSP